MIYVFICMAMMLWHQPETKYSVAKIIVTFIYELNRYIYCSELNKIPVTLVVESGNVDLTTRVWYKNWQNWKMKLWKLLILTCWIKQKLYRETISKCSILDSMSVFNRMCMLVLNSKIVSSERVLIIINQASIFKFCPSWKMYCKKDVC